ncbi:MAG: flavohemoglobin expression-modulating QEGLA motif protein [Chloroflexota bacterium]
MRQLAGSVGVGVIAPPPETLDAAPPRPEMDAFVRAACERVRAGKPLRRKLSPWGRVHVDRPLPFVVVYRKPLDRDDDGTESLIVGEAAYVIASGGRRARAGLSALVEGIAQAQVDNFGSFLIVELWSAPDSVLPPGEKAWSTGFRIVRPRRSRLTATITSLEDALSEVRVKGENATVEVEIVASVRPPGMPPLITAKRAAALGVHIIGLEVLPAFRNPGHSETYPLVHRTLHRGVSRALKRAVFDFTRLRTSHKPPNYHALGRHSVVKAVWDVDRRLAQVSSAFDFILQVTPTNADAAWAEFRRRRFEVAPDFTSRPLKLDTALAKRELFKVPIERVEDPTLAQLFRDQQVSLDRKLTMLGDRGRREFVYGSLQVFGGVDEPLLTLAYEVLNRVPSRTRGESRRGAADARALAVRAAEELDRYREQDPEMTGGADIRKDVVGAMVSRGRLLIGASIKVPAARVEALLAHEVGTHIVTYVNGKAQPFRQLALGLPAYDELQEGLAVFAEYLVGGFSRPRLRLLAARVLAIHRMLDGADFVEVFRELDRAHDFEQRTAFTLTMRAFRGGGLTKDVVYLRGLVRLLRYLREGGSIETLTVGKLGLDHVPIIEELQWRRILRPPPLRPRWLDDPVAQQRLLAARQGITVLDLAKRGH